MTEYRGKITGFEPDGARWLYTVKLDSDGCFVAARNGIEEGDGDHAPLAIGTTVAASLVDAGGVSEYWFQGVRHA